MPTPTPTPFLLEPTGAAPRIERLSFATDVETHRDGSERRSASRAYPRLSLSAQYVLLRNDPEATLAPLRAGGTLLVPAWQHQFASSSGAPPVVDAGVPLVGEREWLIRNRRGIWRDVTLGFLPGTNVLDGWSADDALAIPLHVAQLAEDSFDVEYSTPTARTVSLSFDVEANLEVPQPWPDGGLGLAFPERHNWAATLKESSSFSANRFDAGNLRLRELRYAKRTLGLSLTLMDRSAIVEFRRWIYAVRGRLNAFAWQAPHDAEPRLWRLGSDDVEIQYLKPSLATCQLSLVEVTT
ncbi:hypothetical protein RugamoR57_37610 [Duganella caerulea]|uniref:hypothetical protein n=1 Tax=Duganella caerulea TaxID=2885762 RepID=UPI0030E827C2